MSRGVAQEPAKRGLDVSLSLLFSGGNSSVHLRELNVTFIKTKKKHTGTHTNRERAKESEKSI